MARSTLDYFLLVSLVDQINHDFYHHILLLRLALSNHQRQGHEGVVSQSFRTVLTIQDAVVVQEPEEQRGSNTLVAIAKRVVLRHQIQQHSSLLLYAGIEFLTPKRLSNQ